VAVLAGLLRGDDIDALVASVAPCDVTGWFTSDVAILELAVTALDLASAPGPRRSRTRACARTTCPRLSSAVASKTAAASTRCTPPPACAEGLQPDLLDDAGWWQTRLWIYAVYAAVIYSRAAAARRSAPLEQVARDLAARHGLVEDVEDRLRSHDSIRR